LPRDLAWANLPGHRTPTDIIFRHLYLLGAALAGPGLPGDLVAEGQLDNNFNGIEVESQFVLEIYR